MSKLLHFLVNRITYIRNSIAFYPTLIATLMASLAVFSIYMENEFITQKITDKLPVLIIEDPDTARAILNTMIGGIISLMVFSFSMVMVILNQASSNYSPRLLPGLITDKRHQIVLGIYLGSILFCILCSINILSDKGSYSIPSLTILLSIVLCVFSLGLFIYFIHSISESIQINKIIKKLYLKGREDIENLLTYPASNFNNELPLDQKIKSKESGYLIAVSFNSLVELAKENDLHVEVLIPLGLFLMEHEEVFALSRPIDNELKDKMLNCLQFSDNEVIETSHFISIKSTIEVAVKAMSPGINDPGTAMIALNYLFLLLSHRMQLGDIVYHCDEDGKTWVAERLFRFEKLLYSNFAELRSYTAHDQIIVRKVLEGFDYLLKIPAYLDVYYDFIYQEKKAYIEQSKKEFKLDYDKNNILI